MQQGGPDQYLTLDGGGTMVALAIAAGSPARIVYCGPQLAGAAAGEVAEMARRVHAPGGPTQPIAPSLLNGIGTGHPSPPGLLAHAAGRQWALDPRLVEVEKVSGHGCILRTRDRASGLEVSHHVMLHPASGVASFRAELVHRGKEPLALEWCAAACLPLDPRLVSVTSFTGKWAGEFRTQRFEMPRGSFLRENRSGRTSHDSFPGLYLSETTASENHGLAAAFHLGWSGNHRLRLDRSADGALSLQAGELLLPGEITLEPGQGHATPPLYACWSDAGLGDVTRRLHDFVRSELLDGKGHHPVHYNTWEAVYFDHSPGRLMELAQEAARLGAERFVLDDGWFGGRRSDRAGLGDWFVAMDIYPDGLQPLADHVRNLGMEFGLWIEPEMVNPDSELYRAHPDWVLKAEGIEPVAARHQLPLDLTRPQVCDHLFERIDSLVRELGLAYLKWDMNRDIQHPGNRHGRAVAGAQVRALYALIDRLRSAHPQLAIESCASGGARADYGILARTDRVWTSDNNDARQRHAIMRGAAHFLPLAALGNHVGPRKCHVTGRRFDMAFRAGTAIFGHMGLELDLARESESDRATLSAAIALYKAHRALIHSGRYYRVEACGHIAAIGCVASDRSQALFQFAVLDQHPDPHPPQIRFPGLDPSRRYRVSLAWPRELAGLCGTYAGSALLGHGLRLPPTHPDTCLVYHLEAED